MQTDSKRVLWITLGVFAFALVLNLGLALKLGIGKPMVSDSAYFCELAVNLAEGKGYVLDHSFWPGEPTMRRLPGWPFAASLLLRLCPFAGADAVMRVTAILITAGAAALLGLLTFRLFKAPLAGILAGLVYSLHPTALHGTYMGVSEPLFILLVLGGVLLVLHEAFPWRLAGFALLGVACLVRANFVLWIGFVGVLSLFHLRRRFDQLPSAALKGALVLVLFASPVLLWAVRNHSVCGHFPVISTLRGQVFYGGNNSVVADTLEYWGYWIFPDEIPGEKKMAELASEMDEYQLDAYNNAKGWSYIRANWFTMPRLLLGKLVRAYIPIPWRPSWGSYAVSLYRWGLYLTALAGIWLTWAGTPVSYRVALVAALLCNVATVLLFWGCTRFAFAVEPLLMPYCALAVCRGCARLLVASARNNPVPSG